MATEPGLPIQFIPLWSSLWAVQSSPCLPPDLSPIEEALSEVKTCSKAKATRIHEALQTAITQADILGWFNHCGYPLAESL